MREGHGEVPRFLAVVVVADQPSLIAEHLHNLFVVVQEPVEAKARAQEAAQSLQRIHELVKAEMVAAQYRHAEGYDKGRRPAPVFRSGDRVWLDARYIKTTRQARKLDWKKLGPFLVKQAIGSHAYELELPPDMKIHPDTKPWLDAELAQSPVVSMKMGLSYHNYSPHSS